MGNFKEMDSMRKRKQIANSSNWRRSQNKKLRIEDKAYLKFSRKRSEKMRKDTVRKERKIGTTCHSVVYQKSKKIAFYSLKMLSRKYSLNSGSK